MAKEPRGYRPDDRLPPDGASSGGMNTGVAIIGFILCFVAGAGLMWGIDQNRVAKDKDIAADTSKDKDDDSAGPGAKRGHGEKSTGGIGAFEAGPAWSDEAAAVPVSSKDPTWGKREAPVTVVIYSDYQCPFCSKVEPALEQARKEYGPDKLRVVWKNYPLPMHPNAKPAAEASQGVYALAGSEAFWTFHDTAFKNQTQLTRDNFEKWAKEAGVKDIKKFRQGLDDHIWAEKVEKDMEAGNKIGVQGTPSMFVNGSFVNGAVDFDSLKKTIDPQLAKANAKIAGGVAADKVYVAVAKENFKAPDTGPDTSTVFKLPIGNAPLMGKKDAPITIIEFSDFECPYCSRVEPTLKQVKEKYGDKVRFYWKHYPLGFHKHAEPAAEMAIEARAEKGDAGFWAAHDKLFEMQKTGQNEDDIYKAAGELGLDVNKVKTALTTHKYKAEIDADQEIADDLGAGGTPNFFINGRHLVGAQPLDSFTKIIDEELPKAQDLLAKGVKPEQLYETIIKDGKGAPEAEKKNVTANPNDPWFGTANAKVTIQEFSDFECPFCQRAEPVVKQIREMYKDKVKFYWRDLPLPMHPNAPMAAQAAREAFKQKGNEGFWAMHDKMFTEPPPGENGQPGRRDLSRPTLEKYAQELGLDMPKFKAALDTSPYKDQVDADAKAAGDAGISGTPAFVINGYYISGAQPFPKFKKLIERALAESK